MAHIFIAAPNSLKKSEATQNNGEWVEARKTLSPNNGESVLGVVILFNVT